MWGGQYTAWYPTRSKGTWDTWCWLERGDTGEGVRVLQQALNACYDARLTVDGIFGDKTAAAMRKAWDRESDFDEDEYNEYIRERMLWPNWHTTYEQGWHSHCIDNL